MEVIIQGAIANFSGLTNTEFLKYLKNKAEDFEFYQFQPTPGHVYNASFDWRAIGRISAVLGIVSFIWTAYIELIKPHKSEDSNGGIVIMIQNGGQHNQFWIGNDIKTEGDLMNKVRQSLQSIAESHTTEEKDQIDSIRHSARWKRIH